MNNKYQDRGHKKWGGLFLPEHRDRLQEWVLQQSAVSKPIRGVDRLEELNQTIHECLQDHSNVIITYYHHNQFKTMMGVLHSCDVVTRILVVYDAEYQKNKLQLKDIFAIERQ